MLSPNCTVEFVIPPNEPDVLNRVFHRGVGNEFRYWLGLDRVIQRFLEAYQFEVLCVVVPRVAINNGKPQRRFAIGLMRDLWLKDPLAAIRAEPPTGGGYFRELDSEHQPSIEEIAREWWLSPQNYVRRAHSRLTGSGSYDFPDIGDYVPGHFEIHTAYVHRLVKQRLAALKE